MLEARGLMLAALFVAVNFSSLMRDPIELEVFKNLYHSIAEEMGAALRRTSF